MSEWSSELGEALVAAFNKYGDDHETTLALFDDVYETGARIQRQGGWNYLAPLSQKPFSITDGCARSAWKDSNLIKIGTPVDDPRFSMWYERKVSDANWRGCHPNDQPLVAHN